MFFTDDINLQKLIEKNPLFVSGTEIWKDGFPAHITEKFKNDDRYISRTKPERYEE
jgi:hypothetical protein